jgi:hypothetical protein
MAKDPAFLFYPGDWLGGTMTFSRSHKGAYMDLLMCQFNHGHMCIDDVKLILGVDFDIMWESKLKSKFKTDPAGKFFNEKLENESIKRKTYTAGRNSNLKSLKKKPSHMSKHMESHMENENDNEDVNINNNEKGYQILEMKEPELEEYPTFEDFWQEYDKKIGEKGKIKSKWRSLSLKDREAIMDYIPNYKVSQPEKKYRKNPDTFLNNKSWNDELIYNNGKQNTSDRTAKWANHFAKRDSTGN